MINKIINITECLKCSEKHIFVKTPSLLAADNTLTIIANNRPIKANNRGSLPTCSTVLRTFKPLLGGIINNCNESSSSLKTKPIIMTESLKSYF